jgi:predicted metalloprotease
MKYMLTMLFLLTLGAPLFAQETPKEPDKPKAEEKKEEPKEDEMSEGGKKLFEDVERVWKKFYEIKLENIKQNKQVNLEDDWNTAVKEAKNATYKDYKEFDAAIKAMQKADPVFKRKFTDLSNKSAEEHGKAVRKWLEEQKGK